MRAGICCGAETFTTPLVNRLWMICQVKLKFKKVWVK
jgi:hypothetical protein